MYNGSDHQDTKEPAINARDQSSASTTRQNHVQGSRIAAVYNRCRFLERLRYHPPGLCLAHSHMSETAIFTLRLRPV